MRSRTLDAEPQFQVGRQSESVDEPTRKYAEDPSVLSVGQEAGDPRFDVSRNAPETDEGSRKVAEDPSAAVW